MAIASIDGGEMLIRVLKQHGIREIFSLNGGHLDCIFQAALEHGMRLIDTRPVRRRYQPCAK